MQRTLPLVNVLITLVLLGSLARVAAQSPDPAAPSAALGSAFTYQGELRNASGPVNGNCDLEFSLWDAMEGGTRLGSSALRQNAVAVTQGRFTVQLDFGSSPFGGQARWLQMAVACPAGSDSLTMLNPRQQLTATPYALHAQQATRAGSVPWSGITGRPAGLDDGDTDTVYSPGAGLRLSGSTFSVNTSAIQTRVSGSCAVGSSISAINADGTVSCASSIPWSGITGRPGGLDDGDHDALGDLSCSRAQVASWNGRQWTCTTLPSLAKIAFMSDRDGNLEIYVMHADGSNPTRLTTNTADDTQPAWSPDGSKIAFYSNRDGNAEIYVMQADGSNPINLTNNAADDTRPAWSPDGSKIAFRSIRHGNHEIYVMQADGSNPTRLTTSTGDDSEPAWSPDGSKIAFYSSRDGNHEIYVMNPDGSNPTHLTDHSGIDTQPAWSPDGSKIAFMSDRDGNHEIYVMSPNGGDQIRLTTHPAVDSEPAWSPDGSKITFRSNRDGNAEIYVMSPDGSNQTRLTTNTASDFYPVW